jgi:hypothetical protein
VLDCDEPWLPQIKGLFRVADDAFISVVYRMRYADAPCRRVGAPTPARRAPNPDNRFSPAFRKTPQLDGEVRWLYPLAEQIKSSRRFSCVG